MTRPARKTNARTATVRNTAQRRAIRDVLARAERPLSVGEILDGARACIPALGLATVYRSIRSLTETGWLRAVELPGESARYEVARPDHHHHHFQCDDCGRVYDVDSCPDDIARLAPRGFRLERHEVLLYGKCADCA